MTRTLFFLRIGFCTCLGLALIGLAAVTASDDDPEVPKVWPRDAGPRI
jgi:hypothetical protein